MWKKRGIIYFLLAVFFISESSAIPPDVNLTELGEFIPNSYIIEFKEPSLLERNALLDEQIEMINQQAVSLSLQGKENQASALKNQAAKIEERKEATLKNHRETLKDEHEKALRDINNKISNENAPVTGGIIYYTKLTLGNIIRIFTGYNIYEEFQTSRADEEYYKTFNGVVIHNISLEKIQEINKSQYVTNIYPNKKIKVLMKETIHLLNATEIWQRNANGSPCRESTEECLRGKGIKIAVIDTGIDYTHPDLGGCFGEGCKVEGGYDFVNNDEDPMDDQGHGTHVAGTISANNELRTKGAKPVSPILHWEFNASLLDNMQKFEATSTEKVSFVEDGEKKALEFEEGGVAEINQVNSEIFNQKRFSLSIWANPIKGNAGIFEKTIEGKVNSQYLLFIEGNKYYLRVKTLQGIVQVSTPIEDYGIWAHLVAVYDGLSIKLYKNGVLANSTRVNNIVEGTGPSYIGRLGENIYPFKGRIDELSFYDRALAQNQIISIFDSENKKIINSSLFSGGINGIAPESTLYAYKVLGEDGSGTFEDIIASIERAVDPNKDYNFSDSAQVISMSLGGPGDPDDPISKAADNAVYSGAIVVIAAGNAGPGEETIGSPGVARKVITVGAIDKNYSLAYFSSRGPVLWKDKGLIKPDILTHGVNIYSTMPLGRYAYMSGTSMATPHVAGVAALLKQARPDWTSHEIKAALIKNAKPLKGLNIHEQGYGVMDALATLEGEKPSIISMSLSKRRGEIEVRAIMPRTFTSANISLYHSEGLEGTTWSEIPIEEGEIKNGRLLKKIDSFRLKEGYHLLNIRTKEGTSFGEDRHIIYIDNMNISGIDNYEIYRLGDLRKIYFGIEALTYNYPEFVNYIVDYSINTTNPEWKTQGLLLCEPGIEAEEYQIAESDICEGRAHHERFFIWNTSVLNQGMYNLRIRVNYSHSEVAEQVSYLYFDKDLKEGWPKRVEAGNYSTHAGDLVPVLFDLDKDGDQEIIINKGRNGYHPYATIVAYHGNGSIYWEKSLGDEFLMNFFGTSLNVIPTIGDIDNDESPDIIAMVADYTQGGKEGGRVYALNATGSIKSGYPIQVANDRLAQVITADLDHDKYDEIVIQTNYLYHTDYSEEIIIISNGSIKNRWNVSYGNLGNDEMAPSIGNFDDDSDLEIVSLRTIGWPPSTNPQEGQTNIVFNRAVPQASLYIYNIDGSIVEGWPKIMNGSAGFFVSPSIGDLNGDGNSEIIASYYNKSDSMVVVYNKSGDLVPGFPVIIPHAQLLPYLPVIQSPEKSFTLSDLEGDGQVEIIFITSGSYETGYPVYVIRANGSIVEGWPHGEEGGSYKNYAPIAVDINGDGYKDILAPAGSVFPFARVDSIRNKTNLSLEGGIWAWHMNGTKIPRYPKALHFNAVASPAIGDVDGDGLIEIVGSSSYDYDLIKWMPKGYGSLHVWETNISYPIYDKRWEMFRRDASSIACYECENKNTEALEPIESYQDTENNFTLKKGEKVKLTFKDEVNLTRIKINPSLLNNIFLSPNKISIDTKKMPELNKSASILFTSVEINEPYILYNGAPCPENICNLTYNNDTKRIMLDVTHFSTFEIIEKPICGDNTCQAFAQESCSVCAVDCGACLEEATPPTSPSERGGGGGGGGGWTESCTPQQVCTLGACINEIQIKECQDTNNCAGSGITQENFSCKIEFVPLSEEREEEKEIIISLEEEKDNSRNITMYIRGGIILGIIVIASVFLIIIYLRRKQALLSQMSV